MTDQLLLYVAIFVFVMLIIGLGLTVKEFSRITEQSRDGDD